MRGLIESLLTLTRGDENAPMEVGRYDLGAVAKEATETAGDAADGRVSVEFVPGDHKVMVTLDRERILQVASILLDNAVKYTSDGGSVTVRVQEEDDGVALAVTDTGVGIAGRGPVASRLRTLLQGGRGASRGWGGPRPLHRPPDRRGTWRYHRSQEHGRRGLYVRAPAPPAEATHPHAGDRRRRIVDRVPSGQLDLVRRALPSI